MHTWDNIKAQIDERTNVLSESVQSFKTEMETMIETTKNNEILEAIKAINIRLDLLSARLPPLEEE